MGKLVEERFTITDQDSNTTGSNTTAAVMTDLFSYKVPVGATHVFLPEHTLAAYLKDASAEIGGTSLVQIELRDSQSQSKELIFGPVQYTQLKEFQDKNKKMKLNVSQPRKATEGQKVVLMVNDDAAVVASTSYMALESQKIHEGL